MGKTCTRNTDRCQKVTTALPFEEEFCLIHRKTIEKQVQQNKFYNEEISGIK